MEDVINKTTVTIDHFAPTGKTYTQNLFFSVFVIPLVL